MATTMTSRRGQQLASLFYFMLASPSTNSFQVQKFCSTVHFRLPTTTLVESPTLLKLGGEKEESEDSSNNNNNGEKRKRKGRRFSQTVYHKDGTAVGKVDADDDSFDPDRMWKNKKSIEELEGRLTARWGTNLQAWTAQDIDDYDDDEDTDEDSTTQKSSASDKNTPTYRARPVKDPWATDNPAATSSSSSLNRLSPLSNGGKVDDVETGLARRVIKNQQRLREAKDRTETVTPEFYDHDDVGYEASDNKPKNRIKVDDLISPKPIGGVGTLQDKDKVENAESKGFFFSYTGEKKTDEKVLESEKVSEPREEKKRKPLKPILDAKGNPLFLTLKQAERYFEASLSHSDAALDDDETVETGSDISSQNPKPEDCEWQDIGITSPVVLENLRTMQCKRPLSVQVKVCPPVLAGQDVLVGTYTGSGKTLAFLAPIAHRLLENRKQVEPDGNVQVVIVAPGRELASQIVSVARTILQGTDITVMLAIGGTTFARNLEQIRKRKPTIIVGTPGRIAELVVGQPGERSGRLKINGIQCLVLDEFDALLEYKPHRDPTNAIIQRLKQQQGDRLQSILCSATASDLMGSDKLPSFLREGYSVAMADSDDVLVTPGGVGKMTTRVSRTVIHGVIHVPQRRFVLEYLRRILHTDPIPQQILVFVENSRKVQVVVEKLEAMGIIAAPLHGGAGSEKMDRAEVSKAMREGYVGIVVSTELAARGLDAPLLTHVVNLDLPTDASHYAHRAGRCGRGGRPGVVINLTTSPQERNVPQKFADQLGVQMHVVEPRSGKLNIIDPTSLDID